MYSVPTHQCQGLCGQGRKHDQLHDQGRSECRSIPMSVVSIHIDIVWVDQAYISEIVPSLIFANLRVERGLNNISSLKVFFPESRLLVAWITWQKLVLKSGPNDQINRLRKFGNIAACDTSVAGLEDTSRCMELQWSKCQWLRINALTSLRLRPPSFKISVTSFWIRSPGIWLDKSSTI